MYRHISKGSWTLSDQDQGWQVSDCTAEAFKVINFVKYVNGGKVLLFFSIINVFLTKFYYISVLHAFIHDATRYCW
jgi:hypothetical protein